MPLASGLQRWALWLELGEFEMFLAIITLAIAASLLFEIWLDRRQIRHVLANQERVPPAFHDTVSLDEHRKAAAYTAAKRRFGIKRDMAGAVLGFLLLVCGGFAFIHAVVVAALGTGYVGSLALVAVIVLIGGLVSLPFDYLETFSIEEKFGFNRTTRKLFFVDLAKSVMLTI